MTQTRVRWVRLTMIAVGRIEVDMTYHLHDGTRRTDTSLDARAADGDDEAVQRPQATSSRADRDGHGSSRGCQVYES